jgi:2,3-bisphosphoglycerate-independent phosphoglycerate mutase
MLKWDLNAVTVADFVQELSERLLPILNSHEIERAKLVEHSLTLANVCLICECPLV